MLNMDGIGRLTKRIEVLAYQDIEHDGITKQKLVRLIPNRIWARIEPLRGITDGVLIKYKDVVYKVKTVIDPYEEHTKLELMCHIYKRGK